MDSGSSQSTLNQEEEDDDEISFAQKLLANVLFFVVMFVLPLILVVPIWLVCTHPWGQTVSLGIQRLSRNALVKCVSATALTIIFVTGPCLCGFSKSSKKRVS